MQLIELLVGGNFKSFELVHLLLAVFKDRVESRDLHSQRPNVLVLLLGLILVPLDAILVSLEQVRLFELQPLLFLLGLGQPLL